MASHEVGSCGLLGDDVSDSERTRRILVVDDNGASLDELRGLLEGAGYEVSTAGDGIGAVKAVRTQAFDLVILDVVLPGLDGLQALRLIKQRPEDEFLPVLLTSVRGDVASRVEGLRLGADDFLPRPFEPMELVARVEGLLRIKAAHDRIAKAKAELERLSCTDGLTNLYNHRGLQQRLREEYLRAQRYKNELSVVVLDLDHFKRINDNWGHLVGDEVLREVAALLRESVRETDYIARYGGEEFVMILPQTATAGATHVVERLRTEMAKRSFGAPYASLQVTTSAGIATWPGAGIESAEALLRTADMALYEAKRSGRDRVCAA